MLDIQATELQIKDTTDAPKWTYYLDIRLEFYKDGIIHTQICIICVAIGR